MPDIPEIGHFEQKMSQTGDKDIKHLTPYQRVLMNDLYHGGVMSWTFIPSNIRKMVWDMVRFKEACIFNSRRVGDDPREYVFVILSKKGRDYMAAIEEAAK